MFFMNMKYVNPQSIPLLKGPEWTIWNKQRVFLHACMNRDAELGTRYLLCLSAEEFILTLCTCDIDTSCLRDLHI